MQWWAAIEGFKDRPLLGYGPENHNLVWSAHFDPGIYRIDTEIYDRTHNQFLETLATTGLIGAAALLGIWVAIGVTLVGAYRAGRLSASAVAILAGLQVAYGTYLFFWFFDLNSTMLWVLVAALISSRRAVGSVVLEMNTEDATGMKPRPMLALASIVLLVSALYGEVLTPIRANRALAAIDSERGSVAQNLANLELLSSFRRATDRPHSDPDGPVSRIASTAVAGSRPRLQPAAHARSRVHRVLGRLREGRSIETRSTTDFTRTREACSSRPPTSITRPLTNTRQSRHFTKPSSSAHIELISGSRLPASI